MRGILTWGDANYYPGVEMLCRSVWRVCDVPVAVVDLGLTPEQAGALVACGASVLAMRPWPEFPGPWWLWGKPSQIRDDVWPDLLFIDSDAVVLRDPAPLFAALEDGPVFTPDTGAPDHVQNGPELYRLAPVPGGPTDASVNGGVTGWRFPRDRPLLNHWRRLVAAALRPKLRHAFCCGEQGALLWLLHARGLLGRIMGPEWNASGGGATRAAKNFSARRHYQGPDALEQIAADHPAAAIAHWVNRPKWWEPPTPRDARGRPLRGHHVA